MGRGHTVRNRIATRSGPHVLRVVALTGAREDIRSGGCGGERRLGRDVEALEVFELVEDLRVGRLPKTCAVDGTYFIPKRRNRRFCSDNCRSVAYDRRRANDPKRRKAQAARYLSRKEAAQGIVTPNEEPDEKNLEGTNQ